MPEQMYIEHNALLVEPEIPKEAALNDFQRMFYENM